MISLAPRVLLIEDEPGHADLALAAFEDSLPEAVVEVAPDLRAARAALAGQDFDVVICDWRLPDGDALELLTAGFSTAAPWIVLTSHGSERVAVEALRAGAMDYIVKSGETLLDLPHAAQRAMREWAQAAELHRTKLALRRSEASLETVVQTMPDVIFRVDADHRVTYVSHAITRYGFGVNDLSGRPVADFVHPDELAAATVALDAVLEDGWPVHLELRLITATGEYRVTEVRCQRIELDHGAAGYGVQGVVHDVTEHKAAERQVRQLLAAVDGATEAIALLTPQYTLDYANPSFHRLADLQPCDNPEGCVLRHLVRDPAARRELERCLSRGEPWSGRLLGSLDHGRTLRADLSVTPVKDQHGVIHNHLLVLKDITQQLALEDQLRQAARMEAIGALAGGIAHDFNNILAGIIGYAELAQMEEQRGLPVQQSLHQVIRAGRRGAEMTRQILSFSRRAERSREPVPVAALVKEALKLLRSVVPPTVRLRHRISGNPVVVGDATQLHQVVMNLCANACQAMESEGGELRVGLARETLSPLQALAIDRELTAGDYLRLTVTDSGAGIPPGRPPPDLRAVLHHQGARPRHGHGAGDGEQHRPGPRRPHRRGQ